MELKDYGRPKQVQTEDWLKNCGLYTGSPVDLKKIVQLLTAYRGYIYEAEFRPSIQQNGEEIEL